MAAVPISSTGSSSQAHYPQLIDSYAELTSSLPAPAPVSSPEWTHYLAVGTLLTGGALMVAGRRKSGLAVVLAGTALALLDEQETVTAWWKKLPRFLNQAQEVLDKVEGYMEEAAVQGERLHSILRR